MNSKLISLFGTSEHNIYSLCDEWYKKIPQRVSAFENSHSPFDVVFVKDASLYFTNRGHKRRRREIVITSVKHGAERSYWKWGRHIQNLIPSLDERLLNLWYIWVPKSMISDHKIYM